MRSARVGMNDFWEHDKWEGGRTTLVCLCCLTGLLKIQMFVAGLIPVDTRFRIQSHPLRSFVDLSRLV